MSSLMTTFLNNPQYYPSDGVFYHIIYPLSWLSSLQRIMNITQRAEPLIRTAAQFSGAVGWQWWRHVRFSVLFRCHLLDYVCKIPSALGWSCMLTISCSCLKSASIFVCTHHIILDDDIFKNHLCFPFNRIFSRITSPLSWPSPDYDAWAIFRGWRRRWWRWRRGISLCFSSSSPSSWCV